MSISLNQEHVVTSCGACGIQFTVPAFLHESRGKNGTNVWCPNGHSLTVPQSDEMINLKKEISVARQLIEDRERQRDSAIFRSQEAEKESARLMRRITSLKGANTRLRRRLNK